MMDALPLSLLNDFLFCPRRAALKVVEGCRGSNEHTARGDVVHEHADLPGYEVAKGVKLLRALPVWSERLGLIGKCDIVELHPDESLVPVEFKVSRRKQWENDDAQLCAQALCLEEMFNVSIPRGAIFHAASKRRRDVEFTAELRAQTGLAIAGLRAVLDRSKTVDVTLDAERVPPAIFKPACEECSLFDICLPGIVAEPAKLARAARKLFET